MVSSIYSDLNTIFAASFSQVAKSTGVIPAKTNALEQTRSATQAPRDVVDSITQDEARNSRRNTPQRFSLPDERQPTFASFNKPQIQLNSADEMQLFALEDTDAAPAQAGELPQVGSEALAGGFSSGQVSATTDQLSRRRQNYIAQLYARTNDIAFSSDRVLNQAA